MNLHSLASYDQRTAAGILAGLALGKTTNPGVGTAAQFETEIGERELEVLKEIRTQLKLPSADNSIDAQAKILGVVSKALSDSLLQGKNRKEIVERAGNQGLLPRSMYKIKMNPQFLAQFAQFGTREPHARQTILEADDYQHLLTEGGWKDVDKFSLFLKWHAGRESEDGFWALVFTHRVGDALLVQHFWRVYTSDVDLTNSKKPVDVLRAFCDKFGLDVELGGKTAKFFEQSLLPSSVGANAFDALSKVKVLSTALALSTISARKEMMADRLYAGIVYAIDAEKYKATLRRHGVMIR